MNLLVFGGTRFMGKHLVKNLLKQGHEVTIATRGLIVDTFGDAVNRLSIDRTDVNCICEKLAGKTFDVIFDSLAYCSNDIKNLLDNVRYSKYITISTTAVYQKHLDTKEQEFNPLQKKLVWCNRADFPYQEIKRQAECSLAQQYPQTPYIAVRFPFVLGEDDYTKRLFFYIEHIIQQKPMWIDNYENQMAFVSSKEAGGFLASLAQTNFQGAINGASEGTLSLKDLAEHVKNKTGLSPVLSPTGDNSPYNGEVEYSINIEKAKALGYHFSPLKNWIYPLIDYHIEEAIKSYHVSSSLL